MATTRTSLILPSLSFHRLDALCDDLPTQNLSLSQIFIDASSAARETFSPA
jgi:hypothetical protein